MHLQNMHLRKSFVAFAVTAALSLALGAPAARSAEPIQLPIAADKRYTMEVPRGLCHIDPNGHPADKKYFDHFSDSFKPENLLLAAFGDCPSVEKMRKRFDENGEQDDLLRWAQVLAPLMGRGATPRAMPSGMARSDILDLLAKFAGNDPSVDVSLAVRQLNAAPANKDPDPKNIGTLARDKTAVFTGTMFRTGEAGKFRLIGGIQAMTAVGQYAIAVNDFRTFAGRDSLDAGVADTREIVRGLIARNEK
jgi:hypothetical protein